MTIGIAAYGPDAGSAVLAAWAAAERHGQGDIGGFAVFTALYPGCGPISVECQRGGLATIRRDWGECDVIKTMARAPIAAVIGSGPDRPVPLAQFLAAGTVGLVTGHRLPNLAVKDGTPANYAALQLIHDGEAPQEAVSQVCRDNPTLDMGLIAVTRTGIGLAETQKVQARTDRGQAIVRIDGLRALALLHNSIYPVAGLADHMVQAGLAAFN